MQKDALRKEILLCTLACQCALQAYPPICLSNQQETLPLATKEDHALAEETL